MDFLQAQKVAEKAGMYLIHNKNLDRPQIFFEDSCSTCRKEDIECLDEAMLQDILKTLVERFKELAKGTRPIYH